MYYFFKSPYTEKLYSKIKNDFDRSCLIEEIDNVFLASEDRLVIDEEFCCEIPDWIDDGAIILLSEIPARVNTIYKYQRYSDIVKDIFDESQAIYALVSIEPQFDLAALFSKKLFSRYPIVQIDFDIQFKHELIFDIHEQEDLLLETIEAYFEKKENADEYYRLILFKSIMDLLDPPIKTIEKIIKLLRTKYNVVLNITPLKNTGELKMLEAADCIFCISKTPSLITEHFIKQLKKRFEPITIKELYENDLK